ncbi:MAG: tRNA (adenosine(37)-N6)-dimethylallyltransferase MiaA [Alphaproteobacteria bacterium]
MVRDAPPRTVFVICGPTASGKSRLALGLARCLAGTGAGATIINADSMQVYRGLEILTAQPDAQARAEAPHELYGVLEPDDPCSAGRWRALALAAIAHADEAGRTAIVCGGSGLYLRALTEGIAAIPDIPADVRDRVRARHAEVGSTAFHAELAALDPKGAAGIRPSDSQRMVRAMEVLEATGRSLTRWQAVPGDALPAGLRFRIVRLSPPRESLYAAIDARFDAMVRKGAMAEAAALAARRLDPALPAMKALGVAELARAATGEMAIEDAVSRVKTASRNYAKRQETWFGRQIIANFTYYEKFSECLYEKILSEIL